MGSKIGNKEDKEDKDTHYFQTLYIPSFFVSRLYAETLKNIIRIMKCSLALQKNKPYIAMIFIQFVYAGISLLSKAAISKGMNPYVFVVYRQAFASIALSPFAFFDRFYSVCFVHIY